jgi:hypothetical protein
LRPIAEFEVARHQRRGDGAFWNRPEYCNNFVLRHASGVRAAGAL